LDKNYRCQLQRPHDGGTVQRHPPDLTAVPEDPSQGTDARWPGNPKEARSPRGVGYQSGFD